MSGYENAPITRFLSIAVFAASVFCADIDVSFDVDQIFRGQFWRIFSSPFVFENMAATFVGLIVIYQCRQFERQIGVSKFGSFVVLSWILFIALEFAATMFFKAVGVSLVPTAGPYFIIFPLLVLYFAHVPKLQASHFAVFGINFSEKSWTYLLALQLIFSDGVHSVAAALIGILIGFIYDKNRLGIQRCRLPPFISNFVRRLSSAVASLVNSPNVGGPQMPVGRGGNGGGIWGRAQNQYQPLQAGENTDDWDRDLQQYGGFGESQHGQQPPMAAAGPPPEEAVESLMSLGFDRDTAVQALRRTDNNVDAAANYLLR